MITLFRPSSSPSLFARACRWYRSLTPFYRFYYVVNCVAIFSVALFAFVQIWKGVIR